MRRSIAIGAILACVLGLAGSTGFGAASAARPRIATTFIERTDVSGVPFTAAILTFTDAAPLPGQTYSATLDWGDGTASSVGTISGGPAVYTVTGTHTYAAAGKYTPSATITPTGGTPSTSSAGGNQKQTVKDHGGDADPRTIKATAGLKFSGVVEGFTDPWHTPTGPYTASVNWGDGTAASAGTVSPRNGQPGFYDVTGTHTWASAGTFAVTVTVTEDGFTPFALSPASTADVAPDVPPTNHYTLTPLTSNVPGMAPRTDPNLRNPWGLCRSAASPWWNSDNDTDKSTLYNATGVPQATVVSVPGGPTGCVNAGIAGQFQVATDTSTTLGNAAFIFATQEGKIRAWRAGGTALVTADQSTAGASYFGLAISGTGAAARLYAANFTDGRIDVFNGQWQLVSTPGQFTDPKLPDGFSPFNVQTIGTRVFVEYAQVGPDGDETHDPGAGVVDVYDLSGVFLHRVASRGVLNAPWGVAQAPAAGFGAFSGDLLIGNFGDGLIHAFREQADGSFDHEGVLRDANGDKIAIDGLWGMVFGNSGNNGNPQTLYFNAGPNDETDGLFGTLTHS